MKTDIDTFIKEHSHINYCEAIIYKDGLIEYAVPSHVEKLIKITGEDREIIYNKMPITASPIIWLLNYTGCVAVYTCGYMTPDSNITELQIDTLQKLFNNRLVSNASLNI